MCGRYTLIGDADWIAEIFEADVEPIRGAHGPRYNVAPTQLAPTMVSAPAGRRVGFMRWGLVPHWAENLSVGTKMINARSETVATRPAYRDSFLRKRCVVPADGFYEWETLGSKKQPHWIHQPGRTPFGFAGIWSTWVGAEEEKVHSFSILTKPAPAPLVWLHDRVPVILESGLWDDWLAKGTPPDSLQELLAVSETPVLQSHPVSPRVNQAGYEAPDCIDEVDVEKPPTAEQTSFF